MRSGGDLLRAVGEALYGDAWVGPLSALLDINRRRIERMAAGKADIPPGVLAELAALCERRRAALAAVEDAVRSFLPPDDPSRR